MKNDILKWSRGELDFSAKPLVMGILNVTPDSFSDGGKFVDMDKAIAHAAEMVEAGAAIIDIGPESSRPGSEPVEIAEQIKRAVPVIEKLAEKIKVPISIDSPDAEVARAAIEAGAAIINDISACGDVRMAGLAVEYNVPIVLMHMQGTPKTMQDEPSYGNVVEEVLQFLVERANLCEQGGVKKEMIIFDPGIGFGKSFEHNIELIENLDRFVASGYRVLLGASRKRFLGEITGNENPADRIAATMGTTAYAAMKGVDIVRVHDVQENMDIIKTVNTIKSGQ